MTEYGIRTSSAHVWVHVCPQDCSLYWYSRKAMSASEEQFKACEISTARGFLVPILANLATEAGGLLYELRPPIDWWSEYQFSSAKTDEQAGQLGEQIFRRCVDARLFGVPCSVEFYEGLADQFLGKDFALRPFRDPLEVEVKADVAGGIWGTGNLFVQTHERNLRKNERHSHKVEATQ